jgi:hypothetical protein
MELVPLSVGVMNGGRAVPTRGKAKLSSRAISMASRRRRLPKWNSVLSIKPRGKNLESLRVIGLSILLLGAHFDLYGQQIRGLIVGNVTDASGSAVPEAQITVRDEGTGIEFKTTADAFGYTVPDLPAGLYTVVAAKEGFKTFQATGVRLLSAEIVRQDIALQIGPVQQTIKVVAQPQLVQTDSPTIGGTLQTLELTNLPFLTTTMDGLFNLVPGMSQGEINGNANPTIAGAPYGGSSNFTLNGITTSNPGKVEAAIPPMSAPLK